MKTSRHSIFIFFFKSFNFLVLIDYAILVFWNNIPFLVLIHEAILVFWNNIPLVLIDDAILVSWNNIPLVLLDDAILVSWNNVPYLSSPFYYSSGSKFNNFFVEIETENVEVVRGFSQQQQQKNRSPFEGLAR